MRGPHLLGLNNTPDGRSYTERLGAKPWEKGGIVTELDVRHLHNPLKSGLAAWRREVVVNRLLNVNTEDPTSGNNRTYTLNCRRGGDVASGATTSATS